MEIRYHRRFERDLRRIRDQALRRRVERAIEELKGASNITEIGNVKRLVGPRNYYRISISDYRLGFVIEGDKAVFVRFMHRREIYRHFP